jgi:RNA polymerase sigma factor (sigma-70 family)
MSIYEITPNDFQVGLSPLQQSPSGLAGSMSGALPRKSRLTDFTFDAFYLVRLRDRETATLTHFCDYFYLPIRNLVRRQIKGHRADDVVQNVFVAVLAKIDSGQPNDPAKLPNYIFGICRNLVRREFAEAKKHLGVDIDLSLFPDKEQQTDILIIKKLDARRVERTLQRLAPRYRDVLQRVYLLQQDRKIAASQMNVGQENLKVILCRALKRFRDEWNNT